MSKIKINPAAKHTLSPYLHMQFAEPLSNADISVDAAWNYVENCWEKNFVKLIKRLAPPMIRWGGCFASYYHWKEAVGPRSSRIPMLNLAWDGIFSNQIGTAEFVELCRIANSEPMMCVNMESDGRKTWANPAPGMDRCGSADEAAEWVDYCNNPDNKLRKSHGYADPLTIRYWQIGNETSYRYPEANGDRVWVHDGYNSKENTAAARRFATAMRKADNNLKLLAWGDDDYAFDICEELGDLIDLIAFHCHWGYSMNDKGVVLAKKFYKQDPELVWNTLLSSSKELDSKITAMKEQVKPYNKRLAMTEGHFCIFDGRDRGDVLSTWAAGVAYAKNLNVIARHSDVLDIATCADFFGNRWQVNAMMLPTPVHAGKAYLMPVGEVMGLYSAHCGKFAADAVCDDKDIDVTASVDGNKLYLHIVNTNAHHSVNVPLEVEDKKVVRATAWEIKSDPWHEINQLDTECFLPQKSEINTDNYTIAAAGVAAIELELA
ncbi:MAG: hypothetical protein IJW08_07360 [Lentisphaeria bacterium]|nr:hypothetical protein [Lentisphaeria bacterium]